MRNVLRGESVVAEYLLYVDGALAECRNLHNMAEWRQLPPRKYTYIYTYK